MSEEPRSDLEERLNVVHKVMLIGFVALNCVLLVDMMTHGEIGYRARWYYRRMSAQFRSKQAEPETPEVVLAAERHLTTVLREKRLAS